LSEITTCKIVQISIISKIHYVKFSGEIMFSKNFTRPFLAYNMPYKKQI
jgi:hypothetical protein